MVENHRCRPPLRLRSLAGVIDDKGIEVRQRAKNGFRQACLTERKRLAGKPFQIAVLAEMHHGMHPEHLAKPDIEREIIVRRHQIGRVVGRLWIDVVSARRLDADNQIAIAAKRDMKPFAIAHRIVRRRAPSLGDGITHRLRQGSELRPVNFERQADVADPALPSSVGRPVLHLRDQRRAVIRQASDAIPGIGKRAHGGEDAFRRVQPNTVRQPSVTVRVVGHDQRHPPVPGLQASEPRPSCRQFRHEGRTFGNGFI